MDATVGRETDAIAFLAALAEAPYRYDFYQTLRRLECLYDTRPRWGHAVRPVDEPVRLGQDPDLSKFFHVGALIRQSRNPEGLIAILEHFFRVPVQIQEFVGHWMFLSERERTRLKGEGATLGSGAVLGHRVWDRQNKFQVRLG